MTVYQSGSEHLSNDLLVRWLDEELSGSEVVLVQRHLAACEECRGRQSDLRQVSDGLESFFHSLQTDQVPQTALQGRQSLLGELEGTRRKAEVSGEGRTLARFGWALAAAATLAISISYLPFERLFSPKTVGNAVRNSAVAYARPARTGTAFEMDGETFQYLPYSNPDLPVNGSQVVQMQVPLSSLAEAGLLLEPTANRMAMPDRAVLANVLLGIDGQPLGVHVLSAD